ncbi:hypothetical protein ABEB36_009187 [Hypothenemus hampei]|uniref:Protease inhibitor n=1 Tax=Hypothenemus hampei TaxID=57062 RepID=A0ABD1EPF2_HYPHA
MFRYFVFGLLLLTVLTAVESAAVAECSPNEVKQEDCNTCICVEAGFWSCTKMLCLEKRETKCDEGSITSFDNGCNTCRCYNGAWACTLKFCLNNNGTNGNN